MRLLTIQETAEILRVSPSKCYRLCADGKLPHFKLEGSIRIDEAELKKYLEERRVEGVSATPPPLKHLTSPSW